MSGHCGNNASHPIRLAIVGASLRGVAMGSLMARETGAVIVGVADPSEDALLFARARLGEGGLAYAKSDAELLERVECDAVLVGSGDPYHVQNVEAAITRGKHVFLEKPVAQTMEGLRRLVELWKGTDRVLMAGLELRQCVLFQEMRRLIDEGAIGRVIMGQAFDNVSVGGMYFYHNQYRNRSYVRSLILQKGTHTIDLLHWFMGGKPRRVFAMAGLNVFGQDRPENARCSECGEIDTCRYAVKHGQMELDYGKTKRAKDICVFAKGTDVDDNSMVLIDYDHGGRAFYGESHFTPEYTREFTLVGDEGKMTGFYNNACEFTITVTRRDTPRKSCVHHPRPTVHGGHGGSDPLVMREFARRIREGDRAEAEFQQVIEGAAIAIAATDSAETRQPVEL